MRNTKIGSMILIPVAASTFLIAAQVFNAMNRRMYAVTTSLSSAKSISAESLIPRSDSDSEAANVASESVKLLQEALVTSFHIPHDSSLFKEAKAKAGRFGPFGALGERGINARKETCALPDIEESPYKKTNGSASSRTSKLSSHIKSTEASTSASSIKTAGFLSRYSDTLSGVS